MKKTFTGWIKKNEKNNVGVKRGSESYDMPCVFRKRGQKNEWHESFWPPIKVKVTVETVEK